MLLGDGDHEDAFCHYLSQLLFLMLNEAAH